MIRILVSYKEKAGASFKETILEAASSQINDFKRVFVAFGQKI